MTILIANLPAERDRRVIRECLSLEAAGFEVTVIAPRGDRSLTVLPGSRSTRLKPYPVPIYGSGILSFAAEFLWSFTCIALRLLGEILAGRAQAVQVCNPPDVYWPLAIVVRALGRPWVFDHHDLCAEVYATRAGGNPKRIVYRILEAFEWLTMRTASAVFSTNQSFRDVALKRGVKPEKVTVVRNGPAKNEIRAARSQSGEQLVVYLGVLGPQDNVRGAVLAAEELARLRGREGWRMVVAGDGEELANLKELAAQRKLTDIVEFPGWLGPQGVDDLLSRATCAIQPDLATPMNHLSTMAKTVEYLARGVPVVAVDLLETRRTAEEAALYVPTGDPAEFAKALDDLLRDDAGRAEMSRVGRARFETVLAWEHQASAYVEVWNRLLRKKIAIPAQRPSSLGAERAKL
ncbi:MAG TPA: glycosyltransferase family 4 protein [Candidatus Limnocylindrales bacterium]